jgi:hypothetical protein
MPDVTTKPLASVDSIKQIAQKKGALAAIKRAADMKSYELDKSTEIEMFRAFASLVPANTYLSDHLQGAVEYFEDQVRQDMVFPMVGRLSQLHQEKVEAEARLKAVLEKVKDAEAKLNRVEWTIKNGQDELSKIQEMASNLSHRALQAMK